MNDTSTTRIYTLSLHDALPILGIPRGGRTGAEYHLGVEHPTSAEREPHRRRSEEHTSELQSHHDLVCRLLLEKKKQPVANTGCNGNSQHTEHVSRVPVFPSDAI